MNKMFNALKPSKIACATLVACIIGAILSSIIDGILRGNLPRSSQMLIIWVTDFHYLFDQGIYAASIIWASAKFVEMRTVISVGFDRLDAATMSVKGPDEFNTVWIGRRYGTRLEAEAVVAAFEVRIQEEQSRLGER